MIGGETANLERWQAFADLIQAILVLCPTYAPLRFALSANVLFHPTLFAEHRYFTFILHILLSEAFTRIRPAEIRDIWNIFLARIVPTHLNGLIEASTPEEAQQKLEHLAVATTFFLAIGPTATAQANHLFAESKHAVEDFVAQQKQIVQRLKDHIRELRRSFIVNKHIHNITESRAHFDYSLHRIDNLAFQNRLNLISLRNEQDEYVFWRARPKSPPDQFQVVSSPHILSVPSVLVPFRSALRYDAFTEYGLHRRLPASFPEITKSKVPRIVDESVSQPFFVGIRGFLIQQMFGFFHGELGKLTDWLAVQLIFGTTIIPAALIVAERGQFVLLEANFLDRELVLLPNSQDTCVNLFLDNCAVGFYCNCTLFFGHVLLSFANDEIANVQVKHFFFAQTAVELWFVQESSLLLLFENETLSRDFATKWKSGIKLPSNNVTNSPLFRTGNVDLYRKLWHKQKISTFQYLLALNQFASRSFALLPQYPVFPWIYERDFAKPIARHHSQNQPPLYSSATAANAFLRHIEPHTALAIALDSGDSISDLDTEFGCATAELVPEIFIFPEIFENINVIEIQEDSIRPHSTSSYTQFTAELRRALDDASEVNLWIDLVFGSNSRSEAAASIGNVFPAECYGKDRQLDSYLRMGALPTQLFVDCHPQRNSVMYPLILKLWRSVRILTQPLTRFEIPGKDFVFVFKKPAFEGYSPSVRFTQLTRTVGAFECCAFSSDDLIFAAVVGIGTVRLYRAAKEHGLVFLKDCQMPSEFLNRVSWFSSVAVSTHLGIVCEVSQNLILTFHIASGLFIRAMESRTPASWILFADNAQLIVAIGSQHIEVFTVNGTPVAVQTEIGPVSCCCIGDDEDPAVVIGTG
jgi:hypothetical protein